MSNPVIVWQSMDKWCVGRRTKGNGLVFLKQFNTEQEAEKFAKQTRASDERRRKS